MSLNLSNPILYLITRGATTEATSPESREYQDILRQISEAVDAGIELVQIREKQLSARVLYELTESAVAISRGTSTQILVNDRADIAAGAGASGVHLSTQSLEASIIRKSFGQDLMIGASTHSLEEARTCRDQGADFIVFGPIFPTRSKAAFGAPVGLPRLSQLTRELADFPVLALGGVSTHNAAQCFGAGASGVAGIGLFSVVEQIKEVAGAIRDNAKMARE